MRKQIYRSSITGKTVTEKFAKQNPDTTTKETVCDLAKELLDFLNYVDKETKTYSQTFEEIVDEYLIQKQ